MEFSRGKDNQSAQTFFVSKELIVSDENNARPLV